MMPRTPRTRVALAPRRPGWVDAALVAAPVQPTRMSATTTSTATRLGAITVTAAALLLLNMAVSFDNWWPTPAIKPASTLSLEFLVLLCVVMAATRFRPPLRTAVLVTGTVVHTALAIGRYAEVTLPALFGRPINLYWDGRHLPDLAVLAWQQMPWWQSIAILLGVAALIWAVHRLIGAAVNRVADAFEATSRAGRRAAATLTAAATVACAALLWTPPPPAGHEHEVFWRHHVADPVIGTWSKQIGFALTAMSPTRAEARLPPSPEFGGGVAGLGGADLLLFFLESYGATAFDNPAYADRLRERRDALASTIASSGRHVVSAFVRSPTFGGGSWLAHASLLSGLDLGDPGLYQLLMTTRRPTLVGHLQAHGYHATGLVPGIRSEWAESAFYGFDTLLDSRGLDYAGPEFGFWRIPDQFALWRFKYALRDAADQPQFLFFPTVNTHLPFTPLPPYQADWSRLGTPTPFDTDLLGEALTKRIDWLDLAPAYLESIAYTYEWLEGFLRLPKVRDSMMILVGDHQPAASVTGRDASWDVPVHLVTESAEMAARFVALGFREGIEPARPTLGPMSDLTGMLLRVLSGD
jgi:hypothetical protein